MFHLGGLLPVGISFARGCFLRLARHCLTGHNAEFVRVWLPGCYASVPQTFNLAAHLFWREHLVDCCKAPEVEVRLGWLVGQRRLAELHPYDIFSLCCHVVIGLCPLLYSRRFLFTYVSRFFFISPVLIRTIVSIVPIIVIVLVIITIIGSVRIRW